MSAQVPQKLDGLPSSQPPHLVGLGFEPYVRVGNLLVEGFHVSSGQKVVHEFRHLVFNLEVERGLLFGPFEP